MVTVFKSGQQTLRGVFVSLAISFVAYPATCQTTTTVSKFTMQGAPEQTGTSVIRDSLGRPCLDIEAAAVPHVVNPEMLDHVVSLKNNCSRIIHAKVCYFNSERCNDLVIPGYKRSDTVLGTMRLVKFFRFSTVQK